MHPFSSLPLLHLLLCLLHSDIIEYSLPKLLEQLKISHEEVKSIFHQYIEWNIDLIMDITKDLNVLSFTIYLHQFVDLCILLGCDYCDKIAGLGPKRALTLIQKHRTIENVALHVNKKVPDGQPVFFFPVPVSCITKKYV